MSNNNRVFVFVAFFVTLIFKVFKPVFVYFHACKFHSMATKHSNSPTHGLMWIVLVASH